jgi:hypothetical protein
LMRLMGFVCESLCSPPRPSSPLKAKGVLIPLPRGEGLGEGGLTRLMRFVRESFWSPHPLQGEGALVGFPLVPVLWQESSYESTCSSSQADSSLLCHFSWDPGEPLSFCFSSGFPDKLYSIFSCGVNTTDNVLFCEPHFFINNARSSTKMLNRLFIHEVVCHGR